MALPISVGSGATLASNVLGGAHHQIISPVSLYPLPAGTNYIGLVSAASIHGKVDIATALPAGANYIGLASVNVANTVSVAQSGNWNIASLASGANVTVGNTVTVQATDLDVRDLSSAADSVAAVQSGTWNVGITGLTSLASGTKVGLNPGANFIGLATVVVGNTVTETNSAAIKTAVETVEDAISGSEMQVDVVAALPAGDNNIGNVDLASAIPTGANFIGLATTVLANAIPTGSNFIGGVSVFGNLAANLAGNVTLNPSPNFIGLVTVGNTVTVDTHAVTQSGSWNITSLASGAHINTYLQNAIPAGSNFIGGVSVFGSLAANLAGNVTLNPGPNFIGLVTVGNIPAVTQSGTWNVGVTGLISLASGTFVSLNAGTNNIGDVDIASIAAGDNNIGNVDIASAIPTGANFIGLATAVIGNTITVNSHAVTNAGTFAVQNTAALPVGTNYIGLATVDIGSIPTHPVTQSGNWVITSLASGAHIRAYLETGSNFIGGVSVFGNLAANLAGNVTLNPSPNFIGLATVVVGNTVTVGSHAVTNAGTFAVQNDAAIPTGANFIGLVTVANTVTVASHAVTNSGTFAVQNTAATPAGTNFIGLATTVIGNTPLVSLSSGFGPIKLISGYTSLATVISAAGNATLFVPPSGQRWVMKNLSITAQGRGEVELKSGTATVIPSMALATTSGYAQHYGDSGFPAKAVDQAFVINVLSAATLGVSTLVRFE